MRPTKASITDRELRAAVQANLDTGNVEVTLTFRDEKDPQLAARVVLEVSPTEAMDLIDELAGAIGEIHGHQDVQATPRSGAV